MNENQLAENLMYYRKKKGLSQEKVAEYIGVSRQAVTKWETNASKPSSDNLIKLAQLFEADVDVLLGNGEKENLSVQEEVSIGKMPWIFIGISVICMLLNIIVSALRNNFSVRVLICIFILCVPIQLFIHIYFSYAVKNNNFNGIAGFDDKIEYDICEVKKLLIQIDLHIGVMCGVYCFLFCVVNIINSELKWINGILIVVCLLDFIVSIGISNYKMADKIYLILIPF